MEFEPSPEPENDLIVVHYAPDKTLASKDRRGAWQNQFHIDHVTLKLDKFVSGIDKSDWIAATQGEKFQLNSLGYGLKRSFEAVSLSSVIAVSSGESSGKGRALRFKGLSLQTSLILDGFFKEPYFAPYASLRVCYAELEETFSTQTARTTMTPLLGYSVGTFILLDPLDPKTALNFFSEWGVDTTHLFVSAYQDFDSSQDQNIASSEIAWQLGLNFTY